MDAPSLTSRFKTSILVSAVCLALSSCANPGKTANEVGEKYGRTAVGCVGGTLIGGLAGALLGGRDGALKGAAAGLVAGCIAGHMWDKREKDLQRLAAEENMKIQMERVYQAPSQDPVQAKKSAKKDDKAAPQNDTVGLVAQIEDSSMFDVNSATLTESGVRQLEKLAALVANARKGEGTEEAPILVIGHTDNTGSAEYNQTLSEQRAKAVVSLLAKQGFNAEQLYFQGAGEGRPLADNGTQTGRNMNRRFELVELKDEEMLQKRIAAEQHNPRYIQQSTAHLNQVPYKTQSEKPASTKTTTAKTSSTTKSSGKQSSANNGVDFGGKPAAKDSWELASRFTPNYQGGSGLFSSAVANDAPIRSCSNDNKPVIGEVKNLAGNTLAQYKTTEFMPGMNGKVWAAKVNGHVVYINPVAVLAESNEVAAQPVVAFSQNYSKSKAEITGQYQGHATVYPGQKNMLMRIFIADAKAPIQCLDLILPYGGSKAVDGTLYYPKQDQTYVADYRPRNTDI
ncbi:OmpA family protein [Rheinheimera sp. MM224]|uniref:OmpA family protein n=1 Tax=Rheinheimera sp. MM224 TaxID=3019969 RepID=UPI0021F84B04|nr:OmpA family protein [Rheinheimera sp. MM224]CAI3791624.1 Peptidoglycan-associated lipoprotein [Rheinheimera sp. MM224]